MRGPGLALSGTTPTPLPPQETWKKPPNRNKTKKPKNRVPYFFPPNTLISFAVEPCTCEAPSSIPCTEWAEKGKGGDVRGEKVQTLTPYLINTSTLLLPGW